MPAATTVSTRALSSATTSRTTSTYTARTVVHAVADAPPVHHDEGNAAGRDSRDHPGVRQAPADVVDEDRARVDRPRCDGGTHGVDRHEDPFGRQVPDR